MDEMGRGWPFLLAVMGKEGNGMALLSGQGEWMGMEIASCDLQTKRNGE